MSNQKALGIVDEIVSKCDVCIKPHRRTPPRPVVGLPVASELNEVVTLDLKG